ncbi:Y-family DNA polymerase [Bifidobacterium leontopitheci]|nr:type VI secretion protein ImpB [Bifidobacterium leontopitheci]
MPRHDASRGGSIGADGRAHVYLAIDLKSFYASAECVARGLDPLTTNLVVADASRTEKTICLAVSPSLKAYGLPGRPRLFEVVEKMRAVNAQRRLRSPNGRLVGASTDARELEESPWLEASYLVAKPRMAHYLEVSGRIYGIYLRYAAPEHIHVYSIDEVFIDATPYLRALGMGPHAMARTIVRDILAETGITATAGIGTNMYLAKVAMDVVAKHMPADADGVRVAELDEMSYRRLLWDHRPLTDFWRVGRGYARKLEAMGLLTMGDIARCSLGRASDYYNEDLLYRMFGVNAELLIDHAWGWEPCTIADIQAYTPESHSISSGQVLTGPADYATGRLIVKEMADTLALDLVSKRVLTNRLALAVGYDSGSLDPSRLDAGVGAAMKRTAARAQESYRGPVSVDHYGRRVPKPVSGMIDLGEFTSSATSIREAMVTLYERIVDSWLLVRRLTVIAADVATAADLAAGRRYEQPGLFEETADEDAGRLREEDPGETTNGTVRSSHTGSDGRDSGRVPNPGERERRKRREHDVQQALLDVKRKFGRNAVIKAMDMEDGATGQERNRQIGGHRA